MTLKDHFQTPVVTNGLIDINMKPILLKRLLEDFDERGNLIGPDGNRIYSRDMTLDQQKAYINHQRKIRELPPIYPDAEEPPVKNEDAPIDPVKAAQIAYHQAADTYGENSPEAKAADMAYLDAGAAASAAKTPESRRRDIEAAKQSSANWQSQLAQMQAKRDALKAKKESISW